MPTRIVLDVADKTPPPLSPAENHHLRAAASPDGENRLFGLTRENSKRSKAARRKSSKRIVSFRSSIFRDIEEDKDKHRGLSTSDIRASPRLVGYVYQLLASAVLLISVVKFYRNSEADRLININTDFVKENFNAEIYYSVAGPVYVWKLIGCAAVGSVGAAVSLIITVAHFDTVCVPRFWVAVFRDGSRWEQNILRFMILFWAVGLHVCTSSLSVGEIQGNIFFTTWIAFAASVLNYGVWRTSSGLSSFAERVSTHHRETTYNWLWLLLCICIFAGAATDIYYNRDVLDLRFGADGSDLSDQDWRIVLAIFWSFLGLALISVVLNHYSTQSLDIRYGSTNSRILLGWRHFEGIIILIMVGVFFFLLIEHSGVDGVVNGLTNAYFSLWGAFFNSVFLLGTWLRENKKIEYYVDDGDGSVTRDSNRGVTFVP
jgi:hypothetical protein